MRKVFSEKHFETNSDATNEYLLKIMEQLKEAYDNLSSEDYRATTVSIYNSIRKAYKLPNKVLALRYCVITDEEGIETTQPVILIFDVEPSDKTYEVNVDEETGEFYILVDDEEETNKVSIRGKVVTEPEYDHSANGYDYYTMYVEIPRLSETADVIPCTISTKFIDLNKSYIGEYVKIKGQYRQYYKYIDGVSRMILHVFAKSFEIIDKPVRFKNKVKLTGNICKDPVYRTTPKGKNITDIMLAVGREGEKIDYIPCICWENTAKFASEISIGTKVTGYGRIQSREYTKILEDGTKEIRIAYEVSFNDLEEA